MNVSRTSDKVRAQHNLEVSVQPRPGPGERPRGAGDDGFVAIPPRQRRSGERPRATTAFPHLCVDRGTQEEEPLKVALQAASVLSELERRDGGRLVWAAYIQRDSGSYLNGSKLCGDQTRGQDSNQLEEDFFCFFSSAYNSSIIPTILPASKSLSTTPIASITLSQVSSFIVPSFLPFSYNSVPG